MFQYIKKNILFIFLSNIWVALNIAILPIIGASLFSIKFTFIQFLVIFILAWMSYSWPLYITILSKNYSPKTPKELLFYSNKNKITIAFITNTIITLYLLSNNLFIFETYKRLAILGLISFLYVIPYFKTGIRQINYLKIICISFSWAFISILFLPININTLLFFIFQWVTIFLITLPFDKKDAKLDNYEGLRTFENSFSKNKLIVLKTFLIIILFACNLFITLPILPILILNIVLILIPYKNKTWYFFLLDGLPIYQLILINLTK